jgi:hypothetical protein
LSTIDYWDGEVAWIDEAALLSLAGVVVAWLSLAGASMMTVLVDVAVKPDWSVAT